MKKLMVAALAAGLFIVAGCSGSNESQYESRLQEAGFNETVIEKMVTEFKKLAEDKQAEILKELNDPKKFQELKEKAAAGSSLLDGVSDALKGLGK